MREIPWRFVVFIFFVGLCLADNSNEKTAVYTAWETAHVCPGLSMMDKRDSPSDRTNNIKYIYGERSLAQCYHLNGNLELDISTKDLMDAFYYGNVQKSEPSLFNTTRSVTGYVYVRLANVPDEYLWLDLYGLSYIGGNQLWGDKCHFVVEYMADDPSNPSEMKAGLMSETLDLTNLTFCSVIRKKSEVDEAPQLLKGPIAKMKTFTAADGNGGVGVRIKGMSPDGTLIFNQTTGGSSGGYMQVHSFNSECISKGRTSMIDNHFRLSEPANVCCPEYCDHGCFFEVDHAKRPGTPRWRCSKCKPDDDGNPRFWNDLAGTCDQCDGANRLGIICNTVNEQACPVPLVKTNGQCALECPWGETLNVVDGSCIPCEWAYQSATKMFGVGQDGCDITCAVFNILSEATTTGLQRYRTQHFVGTEAQECRVLTGYVKIDSSEKGATNDNIINILNKLSVIYGKVRAYIKEADFLEAAQQIVGNVVIFPRTEAYKLIDEHMSKLQKLTGNLLVVGDGFDQNAPVAKNAKKARESFEQSGLIWSTALLEQLAVCYQGCGDQKCGRGPSSASWACKNCAQNFPMIDEMNLFSCVQECPNGFFAQEGSCVKCHPNCVGGCTGKESFLGSGGCNKCAVYVAMGEKWECKMAASRPRCDGSNKCEGQLKGQIEKMIAGLKEFEV